MSARPLQQMRPSSGGSSPDRFGNVPLQKILLLNKTGGADRADLVIMNGERLGWLTFDPVTRCTASISPLKPSRSSSAMQQRVSWTLTARPDIREEGGRVGGKRLAAQDTGA